MSALVLRHLGVRGANARGDWFVAPPGPGPAVHLGHRLSRECEFTVQGVALVYHDVELATESTRVGGGGELRFRQRRGAARKGNDDYVGGTTVLADQPEARCDLELTLVLELAPDDEPDLDQVHAALGAARFAGGRFEPPDRHAIERCDTLARASRRFGAGEVVVERADLLEDVSGLDRLRRLLELVRSGSSPRLLPASLGWRAITPIEHRPGTREGVAHAYVEALIGLVEHRSVDTESRDRPLPLWRHDRPENDLFLITQRKS